MSVILDALHKARGDKRGPQLEGRPENVARVLDAGVASEAMLDNHHGGSARRGRRSIWMVAVAVVFCAGCLLLVIAGAFFFLYMQGKRLEENRVVERGDGVQGAAVVSNRPPVMASAGSNADIEAARVLEMGLALPSVPALPTPLPLSDLPVQPPVPVAGVDPAAAAGQMASNAVQGTRAAAPVSANAAAFKLGSIVCENEDCLASLNGRTVREGDDIRQYRVLRITSKDVTLKSITGNELITLSLYD